MSEQKEMDKGYRQLDLTARYEQELMILNKVIRNIEDMKADLTAEYEKAYLEIKNE